MENLSFISTPDLLKELQSRFEHSLFYGSKEGLASAGKGNSEGTVRYVGNVNIIMGLCERIKFIILTGTECDRREVEEL